MKIIPNLDYTRLIINGTPVIIDKTGTQEVTRLVFEDNDGGDFEIVQNELFYVNKRVNRHAPNKGQVYRAGFIENVHVNSADSSSSSMWYIRSHRLSLAYYILGPMLLTDRFDLKSKLGVGLCLANIYHKIELDIIRCGEIYVLYRTAMYDQDVYSLLSTNDKKLNLTKHEHYVDHFSVDDYHDIYVFKIPAEYEEIFELYLAGKWSQFPDKYRKMVYQWAPNKQREKIWRWRFERDNVLRLKMMEQLNIEIPKDAELCHAPNGDETFNEKIQMFNPRKVNPKDNVTISTKRSDGPDDQVD